MFLRDHSHKAYAVAVPCLREDCQGPRRMVLLADAIIDTSGPAFRAYYHDGCAPPGATVLPCGEAGCSLCYRGSVPSAFNLGLLRVERRGIGGDVVTHVHFRCGCEARRMPSGNVNPYPCREHRLRGLP